MTYSENNNNNNIIIVILFLTQNIKTIEDINTKPMRATMKTFTFFALLFVLVVSVSARGYHPHSNSHGVHGWQGRDGHGEVEDPDYEDIRAARRSRNRNKRSVTKSRGRSHANSGHHARGEAEDPDYEDLRAARHHNSGYIDW